MISLLKQHSTSFSILQYLVIFIYCFENFFESTLLKTSSWHLFFLKLNSDNNIFLMLFFSSVLSLLIKAGLNKYLINRLVILSFVDILFKSSYSAPFLNKALEIKINPDLTNGLLLIHPICLYTSIALILWIYTNSSFVKFNSLFFNTIGYTYYVKTYMLFWLSFVLIISIFLGCWWAQLELSWGGWWGWDFVEIVSLNYLIISLLLIHLGSKHYITSLVNDFLLKVLFFTAVIKFSYLDSIHNFASLDIFLQNFYQLAICYFIIFCIIINAKTFNKLKYVTSNTFNLLLILFISLNMFLYIYVIVEFIYIFYKNTGLNTYIIKNKYIFYLITVIFGCVNQTKFCKFNLFSIPFWELSLVNFIMNIQYRLNVYIFHASVFILLYILQFNTLLYYDFFSTYDTTYDTVVNTICDSCYTYIDNIQLLNFNKKLDVLLNERFILDKNALVVSNNQQHVYELSNLNRQPNTLLLNIAGFFLIVVFLLLFIFKAAINKKKYLF